MAYNRRYNPDALPAHAEPEQAAQMLSQQEYSRRRPDERYATKPPPPPPGPVDQYGRPLPQGDPYHRQTPSDPYRGTSPRYQQPPPAGRPAANSNASQHQYTYSGGAGGGSSGSGGYNVPGGYDSPPPQNYGHGPPPASHGRPPIPQQQRPPTAPPRGAGAGGNDRETLWPLFKAVDKDGSGHLTESELRAALVNGDWSSFDPHTVRMMIRMFDTDRSGTIDFDEFCGLWGFLSAWRGLFDRFDKDRSGDIGFEEFREALVAFGYRLSDRFVALLFGTYERERGRGLSFDLFVQACISLKRMTDVFKKYDEDRDGYITLSFEEFLTGSQGLFLFNSISPLTDTGLY